MKTSIFNFLKRGGLASAETPLLTVTGSQRPYIYDLPHLLSLRQQLTCIVPGGFLGQLDGTTKSARLALIIPG